jgi:hypothetical protein
MTNQDMKRRIEKEVCDFVLALVVVGGMSTLMLVVAACLRWAWLWNVSLWS